MAIIGSNNPLDPNFVVTDSEIRNILRNHNIYDRSENEWFTKFNRFGTIDPYNGIGATREYLFFTKPDLHIFTPKTNKLNPELQVNDFFTEAIDRYPNSLKQLQRSSTKQKTNEFSPFMNILSNSVMNTLDLEDISAELIEGPSTLYGTKMNYRSDGYKSDEGYEFTLEFEDTKYLELYHLFKAYEEYERMKKIGYVTPPNINNDTEGSRGMAFTYYHKYKVLHDQFAVFKFTVDEDMETIIHYAILQGVTIKNVPRSTFSDISGLEALKYAVSFHAHFVFDMEPWILNLFNYNITSTMTINSSDSDIPIYNDDITSVEHSWANYPIIVSEEITNAASAFFPSGMKFIYKLKWR